MKLSLAAVFQVWNDDTGSRIEIGEDRDGLGLIEFRWFSDDGKIGSSLSMVREMAKALIPVLGAWKPGNRVAVGESYGEILLVEDDPDGLDHVDIHWLSDSPDDPRRRFTFDPRQIPMVVKALQLHLSETIRFVQ